MSTHFIRFVMTLFIALGLMPSAMAQECQPREGQNIMREELAPSPRRGAGWSTRPTASGLHLNCKYAMKEVATPDRSMWPQPPPGLVFASCLISNRQTVATEGVFQIPVRGNAGSWWRCTMKPGELPEAQTPPERPNAWSVADVGVELDKAVMLQHGFVLDVTTENAELKRDREAEAFRADFAETLVEARDAEIAKLQRELSEAQEARDAARRGSAEFRAQAERAKSIAQRLAAKVRELKNPTTS